MVRRWPSTTSGGNRHEAPICNFRWHGAAELGKRNVAGWKTEPRKCAWVRLRCQRLSRWRWKLAGDEKPRPCVWKSRRGSRERIADVSLCPPPAQSAKWRQSWRRGSTRRQVRANNLRSRPDKPISSGAYVLSSSRQGAPKMPLPIIIPSPLSHAACQAFGSRSGSGAGLDWGLHRSPRGNHIC